MSDTIRINDQLYMVSSLTPKTKNTIGLLRMAQERRQKTVHEMQLDDATIAGLGAMLEADIAETEPVPEPDITTGSGNKASK